MSARPKKIRDVIIRVRLMDLERQFIDLGKAREYPLEPPLSAFLRELALEDAASTLGVPYSAWLAKQPPLPSPPPSKGRVRARKRR